LDFQKIIATFSGIASAGLFMAGMGFSLAKPMAHARWKLKLKKIRVLVTSASQVVANS